MTRMKRGRFTLAALAGLLLLSGLGSAASAPADTAEKGPLTTGRVLIDVRTPELPPLRGRGAKERQKPVLAQSRELLARVASRNELAVEARSVPGGFLAVDPGGDAVARLRERLARDPLVRSVSPEYQAELRYAPNDPFFYAPDSHAPGSDRAGWNILGTGAEAAWNTAKGNGAEVAVIDSGVYTGHPELAARISGTLNTCTSGAPFGCQGTGVTDEDGHGTHVAGLSCATADNQIAITSIGFGCSIHAIKSDLSFTSIINSIYAAVAHGSDAISMSFGGANPNTQLRDALNYAWASGSVPVAAGDNQPNPPASNNYPAQYIQPEGTGPTVDAGIGLVVTSANHSGIRSSFAQQDTGVSIAAFGSATNAFSGGQQGILSTWPPPTVDSDSIGVRTTVLGDNRYAYLVGTSMATPQVAGLVALMRSANPTLGAAKLVKLVKQTASGCGTYGGGIGWGIIRTDRALAAVAGTDFNPPTSTVKSAKVARISRRGQVAVLRLKRIDPDSTIECTSEKPPVSGLKTVRVFASANGGRYRRIRKTTKKKIRFVGKPGRRYRFYSVAVDKAGNQEPAPATPDAKARLKKTR
jgi:serine protease